MTCAGVPNAAVAVGLGGGGGVFLVVSVGGFLVVSVGGFFVVSDGGCVVAGKSLVGLTHAESATTALRDVTMIPRTRGRMRLAST
jgi:hypothetical protein